MDLHALTSVVAIGVTGAVGLAAVIVPALVRRGDREHERQTKVHDERAKAYASVLEVMHDLHDLVASSVTDSGIVAERTRAPAIQIWLWGSAEVRELFTAWLKVVHTEWGPQATDEDEHRVAEAANAVRQRMSDELQGA